MRSLARTVDWNRHRLIVVDNHSCFETQLLYEELEGGFPFTVLRNKTNIGTAKAINTGWRFRKPGEHAAKMDNDVVFAQMGWPDALVEVLDRDPVIGIAALKRNDLMESPWAEADWKSTLRMLPHEKGQRWLVVEEVKHTIGTCQAYSSQLLDKIGYLVQPGLYGFDDALSSVRARLAGFKSVFLCNYEIDHIDPGGDAFCEWKRRQAAEHFPAYNTEVLLYESGAKNIYQEGT